MIRKAKAKREEHTTSGGCRDPHSHPPRSAWFASSKTQGAGAGARGARATATPQSVKGHASVKGLGLYTGTP